MISAGIVDPDKKAIYFQDFLSIDIDEKGRIVFRGVIWESFVNRKLFSFVHDGVYIYDNGKIKKVTEDFGADKILIDDGNVVLSN